MTATQIGVVGQCSVQRAPWSASLVVRNGRLTLACVPKCTSFVPYISLDIDEYSLRYFAAIFVAFVALAETRQLQNEACAKEDVLRQEAARSAALEVQRVLKAKAAASKLSSQALPRSASKESGSVVANVGAAPARDPKFAKLRELYEADHPFEAVDELRRLRKESEVDKTIVFPSPDSPDHALVELVREVEHEIGEMKDAFDNVDVWKLRTTYKSCQIYASKESPRDFKVCTVAEKANLFNLVSLIYETDLYKTWVPGCVASNNFISSTFRQYVYLRLACPFPLKDRDLLMKGYGDVLPTGDGIMVYVKSEASADVEKLVGIKSNTGAVRADVLYAGILLKPRPEGGIEITMLCRIDIKMDMLPDSLFDFAAKYILCELLVYLRDRAGRMTLASEGKGKLNKADQVFVDRQHGEQAGVYEEARRRLKTIKL